MRFYWFSIFFLFFSKLQAQPDSIVFQNNSISRTFYFHHDSVGFYTWTLINKAAASNYVNPATEEFSITINNHVIDGKNCNYKFHHYKQEADTQTLSVTLQTPIPKVSIRLVYFLYNNLSVVRKKLEVINESSDGLELTDIDVEKLRFQVVHKFDNEVYTNYGTNINRLPYKGDYNDAAILLYNLDAKQGAVLGNEAPSVLKNTEIYTQVHGCIQLGLRHISDPFPFKKYVPSGASFSSPATFIYVFQSPHWQDGFEFGYKDFVRNYLRISLFNHRNIPLLTYNTWAPFRDDINEKLLMNCADGLAGTGTDLFIIDAGWYKYSGDFIPDTSKFPHGMKFICDYIRSKGMKAGLWFPVASVNSKSAIARMHPDWLVKDKNGNPANLHNMNPPVDGAGWGDNLTTMSLGSPYKDYLKKVVSNFIRELNLSYIKFDLAIAASAYVHDPDRTGDYESNPGKLYKDREESYWTIYESLIKVMDELHEEFPDLLIDCTFETWGRYNTVDYAAIQHADYVWMTNFEQRPPAGPISVRQMNFDRSRVIPPSTLLIGNQSLNFKNYKYVFFSLATSSLVVVGDPRKLSHEAKVFYKKWTAYLKEIEKKYQYSQYFQLFDVFDRPTDSNWDGCFRFNIEKGGGLLFFFRNNSSDNNRTFRIPCLRSEFRYKIYSHETGKVIGVYNGKTLIEKGINVFIPNIYSASVLTIERVY